jgi:hypothetical protein
VISEMLRNPIYAGERIFNRSEWIKDHETGRRRRYERPPEEWVREERPDLVIVSRETFDAAKRVAANRGTTFERHADGTIVTSSSRGTRPRRPLSGPLECGVCGGSFFALRTNGTYGCGWHHDRGPDVCASTLAVPGAALEARIFGTIRDRVLTPENIRYTIERALGIVREALDGADPDRDRQRFDDLDAEIERAVDLAVRMGSTPCSASWRRSKRRSGESSPVWRASRRRSLPWTRSPRAFATTSSTSTRCSLSRRTAGAARSGLCSMATVCASMRTLRRTSASRG